MSPYGLLQKVSFEYAITSMVQLVLNDGNREKVLIVPITISGEDYDNEVRSHKNFTIVVYKPHNYCFVGLVEGSQLSLNDGQDVHYESYHDSCWRDGVGRMIRSQSELVCNDLESGGADMDKVSVHTSFGFSSPKMLDGRIRMNDDDRTAIFKKIAE